MAQTDKVRIRAANRHDLIPINEIYNEAVRTTTATFDTAHKPMEERKAWMGSHSGFYSVLVAEEPGADVVGWASMSR
jgi:phosphinothricin acetyltransferase